MHRGQSFGTKIDLNDLNDFDTGIPTGVNHNIKGIPTIIPQSGMASFEPEPTQVTTQHHVPMFNPPVTTESECVKNAMHINSCPICSRLYNNTAYHNYAILFLLIICIFLIKNLYSYQNRE